MSKSIEGLVVLKRAGGEKQHTHTYTDLSHISCRLYAIHSRLISPVKHMQV